jgi:type IV secretory pathway TraG/TraD family ATPase VirD4
LLTDIASIKSRGQVQDIPFWPEQKRRLIRNAIGMLQLAGIQVEIRTLYRLIQSAPGTLRQAAEEEWRKASFMFQTLAQAARRKGNDPEYAAVREYWMRELPMLRDVTQATIRSDFTGMFDPLSRGAIGDLFGTTTNLTPDEIFDGKVIVIDLPVSTLRDVGQYAALIWIQLVQRAIDRRSYAAPYDRPVFIWEDEAHYFTIDQDANFQTTSRKKGVSVVRLTQNIPNFLDAYGPQGKHKVNTLLGGHVTKIAHRNSDPETNEWMSRVIAKALTAKHSLSVTDGKASASVSESWEDSCPPATFKGLLNGGEENGKIVEGIVFQSGRIWKTEQKKGSKKRDRDWIRMKFRQ